MKGNGDMGLIMMEQKPGMREKTTETIVYKPTKWLITNISG